MNAGIATAVTQVEQVCNANLTKLGPAAAEIDVGGIAADVSTHSPSRCRTIANPLRWSRSPASSSWPRTGSVRAFKSSIIPPPGLRYEVPEHGRCYDSSRIGPEDFLYQANDADR
jgi:hypothetical protein